VDLNRLDDLMRMVGDMVIRRARLADALARVERYVPATDWRAIQENAAGIERQLRDFRDGIMRVRLVPVGEIFRRMPFVVRDLARETARRVHVTLSGQETQIDKFLVERMMDPVLHLVRNAVSHGIESVSERIAAGKPPDGTIALSAHAVGEIVRLEIADDGRGVDERRVIARARQAGLIVESGGEVDSPALLDMICAPGFSTRDETDRASGRGFRRFGLSRDGSRRYRQAGSPRRVRVHAVGLSCGTGHQRERGQGAAAGARRNRERVAARWRGWRHRVPVPGQR
jgi:two-component system chemotaxis sensor kinase CheA